jgi:hypothetical protein
MNNIAIKPHQQLIRFPGPWQPWSGGGGGLGGSTRPPPPNNLLIIILFSKSCRPLSFNPWKTAKNEDITHTFLQRIQYIVKYAFAHLVLLNCKFQHTKTLFSDYQNFVKSSPKSRKWHFNDSKFKNFLGPKGPRFQPPPQSKRASYGPDISSYLSKQSTNWSKYPTKTTKTFFILSLHKP